MARGRLKDAASPGRGSPQDDGNPSLVYILSGEEGRRECTHLQERLTADVCPCGRSPAAPPDADDSVQGTALDPKWQGDPVLEAGRPLCPAECRTLGAGGATDSRGHLPSLLARRLQCR